MRLSSVYFVLTTICSVSLAAPTLDGAKAIAKLRGLETQDDPSAQYLVCCTQLCTQCSSVGCVGAVPTDCNDSVYNTVGSLDLVRGDFWLMSDGSVALCDWYETDWLRWRRAFCTAGGHG
ncbi:hypothetical protein HBI56_110630 [Parastagonospora nodorum]|nr:hypothetical protein HBH53_130180 [Parastagonospora nodorum]KAH3972916.1 hypothetical protein HBH52_143070 [Parastagonospora nodorum]KAH3980676.1 hypothetical protein HBH51_049000 [Parastagonospora nodorum]KAH4003925.1 hypothetical protein HBI10_050080 [Parastagonospora nodorum]KAH4018455.1 hypothetical protein HBI13_133030 [Parastagonospora nodorum]